MGNVDPAVYDKIVVVERGKMIMETNLDMNGHKLLNYAPPPKFSIHGFMDTVGDKDDGSFDRRFLLNGSK